ncbi:hypothetical protein D0Z07_3683 [Hyphodiscus hymeniophilus]|uniref:Uncharacterized protein n=1 Tax=Hyphodiscus hymeniophilus TaxID=353542 RepID=A0A9P6VKF2_9HELO|nr:hypothetical protein D0Z07_3683 [Hyphodiscus hymeniophilus]
MNRFRTKKKTKEPTEGLVRASTDSDASVAPVPAVKSSKTFRRGKKNQEAEPKLELDLSTALPSSDDFRTSLLMSGLSARFSMLREQDDPTSKLGKASDDSVLFSKRQSRLNDLGVFSHGLSDIAEVSSINGSIRPPFAFSKTDSYVDGYGTDDDSTHGGSIMNRAKPGEGNNLFGGRQKIYKIPVKASGSSKSLTDGGGGMGGRALYENDVSQSAFQKLREREREQQRLEREREEEEQNAQSSRAESPPPSGYNRNRETSSTTSSAGPSITRSSTAATSFTSQRTPSLNGSHTPVTPGAPGLDRTMAKGRRLYETGLDQHLHEQQYSAMNRIDTLTRQRTAGAQTPPPGFSSPTTTHPADRWDRQQISGKASLPNMRAASPPPNAPPMANFDFGTRTNNNIVETKPTFGLASPPLSPPMSESEDQAVLAVEPNDRGKATALGAFSKPVQQYDESKYTQRQLQMQEGRELPPMRKHSPPRALAPKQQQQQIGRMRAESNATFASGRSTSNSSSQRHFLPQDRIPQVTSSKSQLPSPANETSNAGTFLSSPDGSSLGSHDDVEQAIKSKPTFIFPSQIYRQNQIQTAERPPESQHPANRQRTFQPNPPSPMGGRQSPSVPGSNAFSRLAESTAPPTSAPPADSPTLGPVSGLSGMVRQHLRSDSNTSSIYGGIPSAGLTFRFPYDPTEPLPQNEYTSKYNPWDTDDWDQASYDENKFSLESAIDRTREDSVIPPPLSVRSVNVDDGVQEPNRSVWEKELENHHHTRDGSSETQKERQDFKAELASRKRRVQETLKSFHETESRSASPALSPDWARDGPLKGPALNLLKPKSSRGSLAGKSKEAHQSKAMKMLGIGNTTISSSPSPAKATFDDNAWKNEEEEMLRGVPKGPIIPPQTKAFRQARRDAQRDRERQVALRHQQKLSAEAFTNGAEWPAQAIEDRPVQNAPFREKVPPNIRTGRRTPSRERGPPPVTQNHRNGSSQESGSVVTNKSTSRPPSRTSRDRSSSDASGPSKNRNDRYRDGLAKAMAEEIGSSSQGAYDDLEPSSARLMTKSPGISNLPMQPSPVPSPMIGLDPASRNRSNSKSIAAGYFDSHKLQPIQTGEGIDIGLSPRPSPITPYSINSTPSLIQPSPGGSGANTPTMNQGFSGQTRAPGARKKSINKSEISEPKFVSTTSRVPTVDLPPGTTLQKGMDAPPIPPVNPRRRQTRAMFGFGKKEEFEEMHSLPAATQSTEEMSTFSADEADSESKPRQKLRKISSEGGNLNARARQAANAIPSPALPGGFQGNGSSPRPYEGGMF